LLVIQGVIISFLESLLPKHLAFLSTNFVEEPIFLNRPNIDLPLLKD
jgi:uncharacterized membrane protein